MAKAKKKSVKRGKRKTGVSKQAAKLNEILVENFVNLQRAITNLTVKFDNLADQMSHLLQLFEISARSFSEKLAKGAPDLEKDREFLEKLDKLLEQNKTIAKGLTMMEDKVKERIYGGSPPPAQRRPAPGFMPSSLKKKQQSY